MHFLGEKKTWECTRCGRVFPVSESLTRASGAFTPEARERGREILGREQKKPTKAQDRSRNNLVNPGHGGVGRWPTNRGDG